MREIKEKLLLIISKISNLNLETLMKYRDDVRLFTGGLTLPSIVAIQIVFAIEEEFGIELLNDQIELNNIDTLNNLAELVSKSIKGRHV